MANRLTRDQIINRALDLLDSPRLDEKCRGGNPGPNAAITEPSVATQWFQDGLDLAHNLFPMQGVLGSTPVTFGQGTGAYALPSDYVLDYEDGIVVDDGNGGVSHRLHRRGLSRILNWQTSEGAQDRPVEYTVAQNQLHIRPIPNKQYTATFWYYKLPAVLTGSQVPVFPSDYYLIEYVMNRAKEWLRELPAGSADQALRASLSTVKSAGLGQEGESDQIPIDRSAFPGTGSVGEEDWMGPAIG